MRIFKRIVLTLLSMIVLLIIIPAIVNFSLFDEQLDPEVIKLMQSSEMPNPVNNAYFSLMGINATADKSINLAGQKLIERYFSQRGELQHYPLSEEDNLEILGKRISRSSWQNKYPNCPQQNKNNCLVYLSELIRANPVTDPELQLAQQRYDDILNMPAYREIDKLDIVSPIPPLWILARLGQLRMANAYLQSNLQDFMQQQLQALIFWKKLLAQGPVLSHRLIIMSAIRYDLANLSEFIRTKDIKSENRAEFTQLLDFLDSIPNNNISGTFATEQRYYINFLKNNKKDTNKSGDLLEHLGWLFVQENAMHNIHYKNFTQPLMQLSQLSLPEYLNALKDLKAFNPNYKYSFPLSPASLYNLVGKAMVSSDITHTPHQIFKN